MIVLPNIMPGTKTSFLHLVLVYIPNKTTTRELYAVCVVIRIE